MIEQDTRRTAPVPTGQITGVVLAGGRGLRMGGTDKGLVPIAERPMICHVIDRLRPQVGALIINANRSLEAYGELGYPVVPDGDDGYLGPLAGMLAAMRAAATPFVLTAPCDTPLLPTVLAERLWQACHDRQADLAVAHDGTWLQPVFALLKTALADSLEGYLLGGGRKIDRWYETRRIATVDFSDMPDSFLNVNEPRQRTELEAMLTTGD